MPTASRTASYVSPLRPEVLALVVHDGVCAQRAHELDVLPVAHSSYVRPEVLRELDGGGSHGAGGAVDGHTLSLPILGLEAGQSEEGSVDDRSGLLEGHAGRLVRDHACLADADVLGVGATLDAEDLVAGRKLGDRRPGGLDDTGELRARRSAASGGSGQ